MRLLIAGIARPCCLPSTARLPAREAALIGLAPKAHLRLGARGFLRATLGDHGA